MVTRLHLVRHAHADWQPDEGRPLSLRGRTDARRVADLLAPRRPVAVYSSPARRALETVQGVAERCGLEPVLVDDLRERELPVVPRDEFRAVVRDSWREPDQAPQGGEPNAPAQARGLAAVLEIASRHRGRSVVVGTHGNLLALVLNALDPTYAFGFWRGMTFPDVYEIELDDDDRLVRVARPWSDALPGLETERLTLRPLSVDDDWFILELLNEPSFIENIGDRNVRSTLDARHYIRSGPRRMYAEHGVGLYAVDLKDQGKPIGICGLLKRDTLEDLDVGFAFLPRYWSKGYAFESAAAVLEHGREVLGLTRVVAITSLDNAASIALLTRLGFRFEKVAAFGDEEVRLFSTDLRRVEDPR